jgi:hypothetical protein
MAKKINATIEFMSHHSRYPWNEWFDGSTWELTRGEDFDCPASSFRVRAQAAAAQRGMKLATRVREDTCLIQVVPG